LEHFYGAFDNNSKFVSFVIQSLLNGVPSIDLTKGEQKRRFIYIDDVVDAFLFVLKNEESIPEGFNSFDISADISTTIKDFALLAKKLTGNTTTKLNFGALPYRADEVMDIRTDTQAIKSLGWKQKTSLEDGLTKMIQQERTLAT
jgi:nucleoside-diphosphate-sugar epimerase